MTSSSEDESDTGRSRMLLNQLAAMCEALMDSVSGIEGDVPKILSEKGA